MTNFVIADATIPIVQHANVGISVSGGADSAVLLYILMSKFEPTQQLHIYSFGKADTHYSAISGARAVTTQCSKLTGFTNYQHHVDYDLVQNRQTLFRNPVRDLQNQTIDFLYTGITANPTPEVAETFCGDTQDFVLEMRDPAVVRDTMLTENICTPFTNLNKQQIAKIYSELNILETLYPHTRSCESHDPKYLGTHCEQCWWCDERQWGFGKL
jgi:7-cyano-7-deazaguanine synthase in queuosine biosynthesis